MSPKQKEAFLKGEGDQWYKRNREVLLSRTNDPVLESIAHLRLRPASILEIGCANGWRLEILRQRLGARVAGIDPSAAAVEEGKSLYPQVELAIGTADSLDFDDEEFDMVIFGFCLYCIDPQLHFRIVAEADRVLRNGGHLVIFDFLEPFPYYNDYMHLDGLRAYKMEFSRLFLAHPSYFLLHRQLDMNPDNALEPDMRSGVDILQKDQDRAFPPSPHRRVR